MRLLGLWLVPAAVFCGQVRYARLGQSEGNVEVQLHPADAWQPALRNLPLPESAWLRTGADARLEIELDQGTAVRLGPDSLGELSDYTRLSTGQRISLVSLDHGIAYLTGEAEGRDALMFAVPGAQITIRRASRVRLEARDAWSQIAVLEGTVRFSTPNAELDLKEGQTARVDPLRTNRFFLFNEIAPVETDRWSEERDKGIASASPAPPFPELRYGLADLNAAGTWMQFEAFGIVWKPKVPEGWVPFRNGKWAWYDTLGYTWISDDPWGWLPYHYGRWMQEGTTGWFWVPGKSTVFEPGDVYWMRGKDLAGWGPLAPSENWVAPSIPQLYLQSQTTFAKFTPEAHDIDPASRPVEVKDPLVTAWFAQVLPSPSFSAARRQAVRPVLRAGSTRIVPFLNGVSYEQPPQAPAPPPRPARAPAPTPLRTVAEQVSFLPQAQLPQPVVVVTPPPVAAVAAETDMPAETFYPAPVYTGIIVVIDPPEHHHDRPRKKRRDP